MAAVDVIALIAYLSPLVGSADSRRQEMNRLQAELNIKTKQVEPLRDLDKKVHIANGQITEFYKKRFPAQDSQIAIELGKLAAADGVLIKQAKYKIDDKDEKEVAPDRLQPVRVEADLSGNYVALAKFINALERDDMFFIIESVTLGGEQTGAVTLNVGVETYLKAGA